MKFAPGDVVLMPRRTREGKPLLVDGERAFAMAMVVEEPVGTPEYTARVTFTSAALSVVGGKLVAADLEAAELASEENAALFRERAADIEAAVKLGVDPSRREEASARIAEAMQRPIGRYSWR